MSSSPSPVTTISVVQNSAVWSWGLYYEVVDVGGGVSDLCSSELVEPTSAVEDGEVFLSPLLPHGPFFGPLAQVHGWFLARGRTVLDPATLGSARGRVALAGCFGPLKAGPVRWAFCAAEIVERKELLKEDRTGSSISGWAIFDVTTGRSRPGGSVREIVEQTHGCLRLPQFACSPPGPKRSFGNDLNTHDRYLYCRDSREEGEALWRSFPDPRRLVYIGKVCDLGRVPAGWCKMGSETFPGVCRLRSHIWLGGDANVLAA